jgi:type IV pilus assembly protein PilQ
MYASNRGLRWGAGAVVLFAALLALAAVPAAVAQTTTVQGSSDEGSVVKSQRISLNLQDVTLGNVLKVMTQKSGINFLIGSDLVGKSINVYLEDVLVEDALAAIMRANGLWYTRLKGTNIYVIMPAPEGPPVATVTEVLRTNYASAAELEPTVKAVLTGAGSIVVDQRTNTLVVSDIPENMPTLQSLVKELDTPTGQVLIEARIVEFSEDASARLGISWEFGGYESGDANGEGSLSYGSTFNNDDASEGILNLTFGKWASFLEFKDLSAAISAMQKEGLAEVLAEPRVLTVDNREAVIEITQHMALAKKVTYREGGQESTVEPIFGDVGVTLKVTPHLNNDQFVTMTIEPTVSSAQRSSFFPEEAVDTRSRTARTTVMVKDAETVVIGGLLRKDVVTTDFKVPLLGDIPLLGQLFRKSEDSETRTEVVLFLTPRILDAEALQRTSQEYRQRMDAKVGE